jgi:hypothetical protein
MKRLGQHAYSITSRLVLTGSIESKGNERKDDQGVVYRIVNRDQRSVILAIGFVKWSPEVEC